MGIIKIVNGKAREFIQKSKYEFDQAGITARDFKLRKTKAFPLPEGWFHIK